MKVKKLILLVVLLVTTLACAVSGKAPTVAPSIAAEPLIAATFTPIPTLTLAPPPATPALSQLLSMQSTPFSEASSAPVYTITAQIPSLQGSNDARVTTFNAYLNQIVQDEINYFKNDMLAFVFDPPVSAGSSFDLQYLVIGQRADIWSIKFDISFHVDGAAHPGGYSRTLNYDLSNGREITLDELFLSSSNYLQAISDICKADLSTRGFAFDVFQAGADPLPENYKRWNLSNEGFLVINFDEYQVAPYVAGPQIVTIPFSALQGILNPQGPASVFIP